MLLQSIVTPNKAVKPFVAALLTRTLSTPHLLRHGWPMSPEQALHAERRLLGRWHQLEMEVS